MFFDLICLAIFRLFIYKQYKAQTLKTMYYWIQKCVLRCQGIRNKFPRDPWIHSFDGYCEV